MLGAATAQASFLEYDDMLIHAVFRPDTNVSEPATLALFGLGLLGIGLARRKKI